MKRIKYGDTYEVELGDFLVYQKNGTSWVSIKTQYEWHINELVEEKKMNYFVLDGKQIPMSDETAASLREEQKTYKVGDCFKVNNYITVRLVGCSYHEVIAICIGSYNRWAEKQHVDNVYKITQTELRTIFNRVNYTPVTIKVEEVQ